MTDGIDVNRHGGAATGEGADSGQRGEGEAAQSTTSVATLKAELAAEKRRVAALAARNAALEARQQAAATGKRARRRTHRFWVALLLVLGFILTPVTILVLYAQTQVTDTGRYVSTVRPLASDPAIQNYAADQVTDRMFAAVDVDQYVAQVLPDRAQVLAGPLTGALRNFTHDATLRVLQSDVFQTVWVEANRTAHAQLNNILTGSKTGLVTASENGEISVDLSEVVQRVEQRLQDSGITAFANLPADRISGKITIMQSEQLYKARRAVQILDRVAFVLPFVVFGCLGAAVYLSADRRRGFIKAAVAFTLGAVVLAVLLSVGRSIYLDGATDKGIPYDAAAAVFDTLVRLLHRSARSVLAFSIVVVVAAVLAGPSRLAVWFRAKTREAALWLGQQTDSAGWTALGPNRFVVDHKRALRVAVAVVGFGLLFLWDRPTPMVIFWFVVLALVALAVVEFFGRELTLPGEVDGRVIE